MKLKIALVDDVESDLLLLETDLMCAAKGRHQITFLKYKSGDLLLSDDITNFDIIFLDICMDGLNGIDTAIQIRKKMPATPIIFVTSSAEYVWNSFSVHTFDYLLKPYEDTRVIKLFSDLMKILEEKEPELEISVSRQRMKIPFGKIHSVTSQNHSVNLTTEDGVYHSAATFSSMQTCLCEDARFLVCNRGIIVNMDFILKFDKDCIKMLNGTVFPVRQKDKSKLFVEFTQYQFRKMRDDI